MQTKYLLRYNSKGKVDCVVDRETGEIILPKFNDLYGREEYVKSGVFPIEPMTAKEYLNEEMLDNMLHSNDFIAEKKLDGVRGLFYCNNQWGRLFSRRVSKKTEYYSENTDSIPHLRDFEFPNKEITVLDGECAIPNQTFKEVSSVLNCDWLEAITRQLDLGLVHLNVFDIIYYKGKYLGNLPLYIRKVFLHKYLQEVKCPYLDEIEWFDDKIEIDTQPIIYKMLDDEKYKVVYPTLYKELQPLLKDKDFEKEDMAFYYNVSKQAYYEYIIATGGEGIMLKPKNGRYYQKRGREYTKYKKFLTKDVVVLDFLPPTKDYAGKEATSSNAIWHYWYNIKNDSQIVLKDMTMKEAKARGLAPCTKYYALNEIGTILFGVKITDEEIKNWEKVNKTKAFIHKAHTSDDKYLVVGKCGGFDDHIREEITKHKNKYLFNCIEVLCNEIFKKTGKLRHPRFLRFRYDKDPEDCTWASHIDK